MRGYTEIERIVNGWGIQMRATRIRNLVLLVYGIMQSHSGSLSAIVRHWPYGDGNPETWNTLLRDWDSLGVTHISFDSMGCGFNQLESHLLALKSFAEVAGLYR